MSTAANPAREPVTAEFSTAVWEHVGRLLQWMLRIFDAHVGNNRFARTASLLVVYALMLGGAFWLSYELRWDFAVAPDMHSQRVLLIGAVILCKLLLLHSFGQFKSVLSYFSLADFGGVLFSMLAVSGFMIVLWLGATSNASPPRGIILMDLVLSTGFICGFRLSLRLLRSWCLYGQVRQGEAEKHVAIIGAGDVGEAMARDLLSRRGHGLKPVFFVDDDPSRIGRSVHGLPVYGPLSELVSRGPRSRINELLITVPSVSPRKVQEIVDIGRRIGAQTQIVPSLSQLASGEVKIERSRPVAIEDLLGRDPVNLDSERIGEMLRDRIVLVTGAGGSIGSELCRQILARGPKKLLMVDQVEIALFEIEQELLGAGHGQKFVPLIADIAEGHAIRAIFEQERPEIVFHASAHKHVPLMERQPGEAIKNNTLATAGLARLASEFGVARFVFISTDKAVNPTSVMGCSKRLAEKALQAQQNAPGNRTTFQAVRFGNVLGSSGSVIPTFKKQIAAGGPVTVTHPEMTRYFMTIPEAVGLVLQAATLGEGGEIFVLDMSQPVKIIDLARQMIELSGYKPEVDIEIKITGLRPGEKLYEELRHSEETHTRTEHPRIYKLRPEALPVETEWLDALRQAALTGDGRHIKQTMKRFVPEYTPFAG